MADFSTASEERILNVLERMCRDAYDQSAEELMDAFRLLSALPCGSDYPFLLDAVKAHINWMKHCDKATAQAAQPGVYVIEYGDGVVKIGRTTNFEQRLRTLSTTSFVRPTRSYFHETESCAATELAVHREFAGLRCNGEFFKISFENAVQAVKDQAEERGRV